MTLPTVVDEIGHERGSAVLLVIDVACFVVLFVLYVLRAVRYRREVLADLVDPERTFAFFTFVAACNVLGVRLALDANRRFDYAPPLWSVVFPLGMYAAASIELGRAAHLPLIVDIGHVAAWVALFAWAIVFVAMLCRLFAPLNRWS